MSQKGILRTKVNGEIVEYYPQTTYDNVINETGGNLDTDIKDLKQFKQTTSTKLDGIASSATKTEKSTTNGNIKINGVETTVYTHPTSSGNKHIPSGGSSGQILRWSADGTAVWGADKDTTYSVATQSANGLMSAADKTKLDGIATGANNYVHPSTDGNKHVPANGTGNNGKFLQATGTAGTYQWASLPTASTSVAGVVQLTTSTASTSTTLAATASAVKAAYDLANSKANASHTHSYLPLTGGTIDGDVLICGKVRQFDKNGVTLGFETYNDTTPMIRTGGNSDLDLDVRGSTDKFRASFKTTGDFYAGKDLYANSGTNKVYHTGNKPTKSDVGLGSVNNWGASSSISANSTSEYATTNMVAQVRAEKANASHTHNYAGSSSAGGAATTALACTGNAATATKLQTARTISLTGDVSGSGTFDGSGNLTITGRRRVVKCGNSTTSSTTNIYFKVASFSTNANYTDARIIFSVTSDYNSSASGILNVMVRRGSSASTYEKKEIVWTTCDRIDPNIFYLAYGNDGTNTTFEVWVKTNADHLSYRFSVLDEGKRNDVGNPWTLYNSQTGVASITSGYATVTSTVASLSNNSASTTKLQTARAINGTNFDGTGAITTANWGTARTITIGNTGKSVNGSAAVSWTLAEIGAAASSHTHNYAGSSSAGGAANSAIKLATARTINGVAFDGTANITISASANGGTSTATSYVNVNNTEVKNSGRLQFFQKSSDTTINPDSGWWSVLRTQHSGYNDGYWQEMAYSFSGDVVKFRRNVNGTKSSWRTFAFTDSSISGNAGTATKLQTARTINGTSFDGSANITTANWGTARTLTIGSTGKSVNGSGNVSWSLSEIGAAAASHTHNYAGSSSAGGAATTALACTGNSATATKLQTKRTIFGKDFDGSANVAGRGLFYGTYTSLSSGRYAYGGIEIRESELIGTATDNVGYAPQIGFNWSGRTGATLLMNGSGQFQFINKDGGYANVRGGTFTGTFSGNASTATTLATARTINGTSFNGSANITTANWGTARTLTIGATGKSVNGSGNVSWSHAEMGTGRAYSASYSFGGSQVAMTTANFVSILSSLGAFSQPYWVTRGSWSYASNKYINDTGCGDIHLAGCTVEVIGNSTQYTIRIHTPTTSANGATHSEYVYINNGTEYSPGWRKIWNDKNDGHGSGLDADVLDGKHASDLMQNNWATGDLNNMVNSGAYRVQVDANRAPGSDYGQVLVVRGASDTVFQVSGAYGGRDLYWRAGNPPPIGAGVWSSWHKIYHSGGPITRSTAGPSGGTDGDIWIKYS